MLRSTEHSKLVKLAQGRGLKQLVLVLLRLLDATMVYYTPPRPYSYWFPAPIIGARIVTLIVFPSSTITRILEGALYGSFREFGVPSFGVLIIRILLFRVLY